MATVVLQNVRQLRNALESMGDAAEKEIVQGLRNAARYGATAVLRTSAQTDPRPKASGTYERSWLVLKVDDGAVLANSAKHAPFVERGRKPGRAPPLKPILEWILQKRIIKRKSLDPIKGAAAHVSAWRKRQHRMMAIRIQMKIKHKGTPGRWILRRTMPRIAKRARLEVRRAFARIAKDPPR